MRIWCLCIVHGHIYMYMYHSKNSTCICVLHILFKKKDCSSLVSTCLHHEFNSVHLFAQMNTGNYWSYKQSMLSVSMSWRRLVTCLSYNTRSIRTTSKRLAKLFFKPWFMSVYFVHRSIHLWELDNISYDYKKLWFIHRFIAFSLLSNDNFCLGWYFPVQDWWN